MKKIWIAITAAFLVAVCTCAFARESVLVDGHTAVKGRILIAFEPDMPVGSILSALEYNRMPALFVSTRRGERLDPQRATQKGDEDFTFWLATTELPPDLAVIEAMKIPGVIAASPDYLHFLHFRPDDPRYMESQPNMRQIGLERVWNLTFGKGVTVAVIDTGYRTIGMTDSALHILDGYDFHDRDDDFEDTFGHGTLVANVIGEATDNQIGCAAVAPAANILPVKVFPDGEDGASDSDIIDALYWVAEQGVDIVNMSFGGGEYNPLFEQAIDFVYDSGIFLVAATGNAGEPEITYPALYENVFAVGSSDRHDFGELPTPSDFSNYGTGLDILAPGDYIIQEGWTQEYGVAFYAADGTSLSCPHVAAAAALMFSLSGKMDPEQTAQILRDTALSEFDYWDTKLGYGELDVTAAVTSRYGPLPNTAPTAVITATPETGQVPLSATLSAKDSLDDEGNIIEYVWEFDNGDILEADFISYTFYDPDDYLVTLTVTDAEGLSDSAEVIIEVNSPAAPDDEEEDSGGCGCDMGG